MADKENKTVSKEEKTEKDAKDAKKDTAKATTDVKDSKKTSTTDKAPEEEGKVQKVKKNKSKRTVTAGRAYIQSSFNNTLVTITDLNGNVIAWSSAGSNGFKGAKKATPYAAQISSEAAINKALLFGLETLEVFVKGIGSGREQAIRGLNSNGVNIESITDQTPIAHNGCRPRKARRV
jgi:small subunit ribosomal protein S11